MVSKICIEDWMLTAFIKMSRNKAHLLKIIDTPTVLGLAIMIKDDSISAFGWITCRSLIVAHPYPNHAFIDTTWFHIETGSFRNARSTCLHVELWNTNTIAILSSRILPTVIQARQRAIADATFTQCRGSMGTSIGGTINGTVVLFAPQHQGFTKDGGRYHFGTGRWIGNRMRIRQCIPLFFPVVFQRRRRRRNG
jgi:hypothetical protein